MKIFPAFLFLLLFFTGIAEAGNSISLTPETGHDNQDQITEALKNYDNVYLEAGVYEVSGKIEINSWNTLTGDEDAIIRVWSGSSQWFIRTNGIITGIGTSNVTISNIQIDGNCDELPSDYADYKFPGESGKHNTEKAIALTGSTNHFMENISISNVKIYDCFSDGVRVAFADYVYVDGNFISNTQHECVYFVCVRSGLVQNNVLEGITSDCVRFDNCQDSITRYSVLDSYDGDNNNGAPKFYHQGIQISDQGRSFNSGSNKPLKTKNIEVYGNTFTGKKRMNVWLDSSNKGVENVYIHDNEFLDGEAVETEGTSVKDIPDIGDATDRPSGVKRDVQAPDIYRVLLRGFSFLMVEKDLGASATVIYNNISFDPHSLIEVEGDDLKLVKFEYDGNTTRYFIEKEIWTGDIEHIGEELYIPGQFEASSLKITVYSEEGYQKVTDIKIIERKLTSAATINPDLFIFITVLAILGLSISRNLRRIFQ